MTTVASNGLIDPGILELVGEIADRLGLAEHVQRVLPTQRLKVQRRHRRVDKLLDAFNETLNDARAALRVLSTTIQPSLSEPDATTAPGASGERPPRIGFSMPRNESPVYRRGIEQLQAAIQK